MNEPQWLSRARDLVGLKEIHGAQHEPMILALARDAGLGWIRNDETAWCAVFVGGVLAREDIKPSGSAAARSYQHWGIDVLAEGTTNIPLGAVVVFARPPNPAQGHVGFAVGLDDAGNVMTLGGNQHDSVSIDAVAAHRLIAARWPHEYRGDLRILAPLPRLATTQALSTAEA